MNKTTLINKDVDTSQFSPADWKRITDYVDLLLMIDRRLSKKSSSSMEAKHDN